MGRLARVVIPGQPHHVTQRGNRRQRVFFRDDDKIRYLRILQEQSRQFGCSIWAYCLMDNHVHLVVVPKEKESLTRGIGETHRLYSRRINFRKGWRGYLWQGRFGSSPMDERYLYAAVRYVERNPVRAGIVKKAEQYSWSSARAHIKGCPDPVLERCYLQDEILDWRSFLDVPDDRIEASALQEHVRTGRPLGSPMYVMDLEKKLGRKLLKRRPGRKGN